MAVAARTVTLLSLTAVLVAGCAAPPADSLDTTAAAAQPSAGFPVTVENCGHNVTVDAPPQRAVSINQPATELMLSLGLADQMIGSAAWHDPVPSELSDANATVPVLTANDPSFERVLETEPDFVYASFDSTFTDAGVAPRDRFERLGVSTYQSGSECGGRHAPQDRPLTMDDLYTEIGDVAALFGVTDRGDDLVDQLSERMSEASEGLDADGVTLMWWYSATRDPYVAGCCGAPGIVTDALGATNAFADDGRPFSEVSWEAVLDRDPDVLILADLTRGGDGDSAAAKITFLQQDPVARQLTAVRDKRWIVVPGAAMDPSLRTVDAAETVAAGLRDLELAGQ
ncbi:ABC transporter substrate-binding protein [Mycolicibacterium thermoresistibile]